MFIDVSFIIICDTKYKLLVDASSSTHISALLMWIKPLKKKTSNTHSSVDISLSRAVLCFFYYHDIVSINLFIAC